MSDLIEICPRCDSDKEIHGHKCWACNGRGTIYSEKEEQMKPTKAHRHSIETRLYTHKGRNMDIPPDPVPKSYTSPDIFHINVKAALQRLECAAEEAHRLVEIVREAFGSVIVDDKIEALPDRDPERIDNQSPLCRKIHHLSSRIEDSLYLIKQIAGASDVREITE